MLRWNISDKYHAICFESGNIFLSLFIFFYSEAVEDDLDEIGKSPIKRLQQSSTLAGVAQC